MARQSIDPAAFTGTVVYTDGACAGNPGPGGWGWAVPGGPTASGGHARTTNQRMELTAALEAVRTLPGPLLVMSDSTYVVNCFRDSWWKGWLARDWLNSQKKPVANRDLWEPLIDLFRTRGDVTFQWLKGHAGDPMNELVDQLAVKESLRFGADPEDVDSDADPAPALQPADPASTSAAAVPSAGTRGATQRALKRGAAADTGMLDLFDTAAVDDYKRTIYAALLGHVLKAARSDLGLADPRNESDDDAQRQALDDVTSALQMRTR